MEIVPRWIGRGSFGDVYELVGHHPPAVRKIVYCGTKAQQDAFKKEYETPPQLDETKELSEQWETRPQDSHRNDVYSLGLTMWEIIERKNVFSEYGNLYFNRGYFLAAIILKRFKELSRPECQDELGEIVEKCTNFNRSLRPNAQEVVTSLGNFRKLENVGANAEKHRMLVKSIMHTSLYRHFLTVGFDELIEWNPAPLIMLGESAFVVSNAIVHTAECEANCPKSAYHCNYCCNTCCRQQEHHPLGGSCIASQCYCVRSSHKN
ncbi:unnamed protein product, partial [Mesorhabditis belari]|uniref:Protein kinase domain-containing protein n=1 Tax=Mesorhabditis belari TaxID=2138241 RepID=A0AAF3J4L4_9BILA